MKMTYYSCNNTVSVMIQPYRMNFYALIRIMQFALTWHVLSPHSEREIWLSSGTIPVSSSQGKICSHLKKNGIY